MNITVFGASGGIGGHVVALAVQRGHHVRAVHRQAPAVPPAGAETVIAPDAFDPGFALLAVKGADAVVSVVGPNFTTRHNPRTAMTSPPDLHQRLARTLITAMRQGAPRARLICVSTASMGPADAAMGLMPRLLFRFFRTVAVPNLGRIGRTSPRWRQNSPPAAWTGTRPAPSSSPTARSPVTCAPATGSR